MMRRGLVPVAGRLAAAATRRLATSSGVAVRGSGSAFGDLPTTAAAAARLTKAQRDVTLALAPPDAPAVELPANELADLSGLYDALMKPLGRQRTQREKVEALVRVEALDAPTFWAERDAADLEQHAYRIRALGAQRELEAAHGAFSQIGEVYGLPPDGNCFAALAEACARAGDVEAAEDVLRRVEAARLPLTAPLFTSLMGAHRRAGNGPSHGEDVLEMARSRGVTEDAPLHTALIKW